MTRRAALALAATVLFTRTLGKEVQIIGGKVMQFTAWKLIETFESCQLTAYTDGSGIPTIGWGHTKNVKLGDTCTQAQADAWLRQDVGWSEVYVNSALAAIQTPQLVFDALCDFVYNVGIGTAGKSSFAIYARQHNWQKLCATLGQYVHDRSGQRLLGLVRRRRAEIAMIEQAIPGFKFQGAL